MKPVTEATRTGLELLIDTHGVEEVLRAISLICYEKGEHVSYNWQDQTTARCWANASRVIEKCANNRAVRAVSEG